ncbi:MAG TPA: hypothetical protein VJI71_03195 [Candidatus Norongarragalinales archaeon]|nr:hypothetical protein [Candidatus Norongarragalinales archaeon]
MDARELKIERDSARREAKNISFDNRKKISELKELFDKTKELKNSRDKENDLSAELRQKREEAKIQASQCKARLYELRKKMTDAGEGKNPIALQDEVERLEWIQQTESLNSKEEKQFAKQISELRKQLPKAKEFQDVLVGYYAERKKLRELETKEREFHSKMVEHSNKAKALHDQLMAASKQIDSLQKSISSAIGILEKKFSEADEKHAELVKTVGEHKVREMEERQKEHADHSRRLQAQHQKVVEKAKAIYSRFKTGEKISLDEMMVLRDSGLL